MPRKLERVSLVLKTFPFSGDVFVIEGGIVYDATKTIDGVVVEVIAYLSVEKPLQVAGQDGICSKDLISRLVVLDPNVSIIHELGDLVHDLIHGVDHTVLTNVVDESMVVEIRRLTVVLTQIIEAVLISIIDVVGHAFVSVLRVLVVGILLLVFDRMIQMRTIVGVDEGLTISLV